MARIKRKIIDRLSVLQWDKKEDGEHQPTILEIILFIKCNSIKSLQRGVLARFTLSASANTGSPFRY